MYNIFMAVYFFYGDEDFNIEIELDKMKSKLNQDFLAMNYQVYDNPEFTELINILRTPPMMFGETLIVINADKYFSNKKTYFEDKDLEDIEDALNNNPENLNIVFVIKLPRDEDKKIDSRRKLYKILSKFNTQEFATYKYYETEKLELWTKQRAKSKGLLFENGALNLLIEQIGNNLRNIDVELEKLKLMAHPENIITQKMIEDITISNQDLFNITEYLIKNQKDKALLEFKKLCDKKHPLEIITALQTMIRKWIIIKTNPNKLSHFELGKLIGNKEGYVKATLQKLKNTSASDLVNLKQNLFDVEYRIKSGQVLDVNSEVEYALIG